MCCRDCQRIQYKKPQSCALSCPQCMYEISSECRSLCTKQNDILAVAHRLKLRVSYKRCDVVRNMWLCGSKGPFTQSESERESEKKQRPIKDHRKQIQTQECIPVGCVPPSSVAIGEGGVGLDLIPLNFPLGCGPGDPPPPEQAPPLWDQTPLRPDPRPL